MLFVVLQRHEPQRVQNQHKRRCKASVRTFIAMQRDLSVLQHFNKRMCTGEVRQWCSCIWVSIATGLQG